LVARVVNGEETIVDNKYQVGNERIKEKTRGVLDKLVDPEK
jgi:hypothetical protein